MNGRENAVKQLKLTYSLLEQDNGRIAELAKGKMDEFFVRMSIRTYSAFIEGVLFQLSNIIVRSLEEGNIWIKDIDIDLLQEKKSVLNDKGEVVKKDNHQNFKKKLLYILKSYPKIHGVDFHPNTGDSGWEAFQEFIRTRNRLVHPKSHSDLQVTVDEWNKCSKGLDWFYSESKRMLTECSKANENDNLFHEESFIWEHLKA